MSDVTETSIDLRLARDGGPPARSRPEWPMFPGGMELGDEELEARTRVIRSKNVFRYYGVGDWTARGRRLRARVRRVHGCESMRCA